MSKKEFAKIGVATLSVIMMAACSSDDKSNDTGKGSASGLTMQQLEQRVDSLQRANEDMNELLGLVNELGEGMEQIKSVENILSSENLQTETPDRRQKIRDDMADIQRELNDRRQRLSELEARLAKSNNNNASLRQAIVSLKSQIAAQTTTIESLRHDLASANIYIEQLTENVDSLNTAVNNTLEEKNLVEQENEELTNKLNTCYYAIGSKSELKEQKIIETGFLRKTKIMPEDFQMSYFTTGDIRTLTSIPLHSKKAKVLTQQPADAYTISTDANGMKVLNITNPSKFWSTYKYLVIQID